MSFSNSSNITITGGTFNVVSGNMTNNNSTHVANYHRGSGTTNYYNAKSSRSEKSRKYNHDTTKNYTESNVSENTGSFNGQMFHEGTLSGDRRPSRHMSGFGVFFFHRHTSGSQ